MADKMLTPENRDARRIALLHATRYIAVGEKPDATVQRAEKYRAFLEGDDAAR